MAEQLLADNPTYTKSILARALDFCRESWYYHSRLEKPDKELANKITNIHDELDDTLGHKSLASLVEANKKRVLRVMKKYGIVARKRSKRYHYHGKSTLAQPNIANRPEIRESFDQGVVYSDIFEFALIDGSKVRGCFALLRQTRQILSMVFDYSMKATLVQTTLQNMSEQDDVYIWHSDQGKQYGAKETIALALEKGLLPSMSRAGTPTDNPFAERFVGQFKHSVVRRQKYPTLGSFLYQAEKWINFYNHSRPHESLAMMSPNSYAQKYGWKPVPYISKLTVE